MKFRGVMVALAAWSAFVSVSRADVITDWNGVLVDVVRDESLSAPEAARAFAILNIAMFDTINSFELTHEEYVILATPDLGAVADTAAAAAAHHVLSTLFPDRADDFDADLSGFLPDLPDLVFAPSRDFGVFIANAVLNDRKFDGSDETVGYSPVMGPGEWQPTPPGNAAALLPHWGNVRPFAMTTGSQFRRSGPPELSSARYTEDFEEVAKFGEDNSASRTASRTEAAQFWSDGPGTATAPGHWIEIASTIAVAEGNTPAQNARVFALLSIALADAAIAAWDTKYAFDDWRPITAIRSASTDGNDETDEDAAWSPLVDTPAHPGYVSENAVFAGAATRIMEIIYGKNNIEFTATSDSTDDATRTYNSLSGAGDEAAASGVWAGTHFSYATEDGLAAGREIGSYVHANNLRRMTTPPTTGSSSCAPGGCGPGGLFTSMCLLLGYPMMRRQNRRR